MSVSPEQSTPFTDGTFGPDTIAVHAGRDDLNELGVHALPLDLSTTNPLGDLDDAAVSTDAFSVGSRKPKGSTSVYARVWNPTIARFEEAFAITEHAEDAVAFATGMAATTAALVAFCVSTGKKHVVAVRPLYGGTDAILTSAMLGTEVTFCAIDEVAASIRPDTGLVFVETPANPTLDLVNIRAAVDQAGDVPVIVDNTFATPVLQNPLDHGATLSLHSATKYIGGHGDTMGGVIACSSEAAAKLRQVRVLTGATLHPLGGYLLHRGLTTMPLRVRAQQESAAKLAEWLVDQPAVAEVYYPGIKEDTAGVLGSQMRGTGAMLAIRLKGGHEAARKLSVSVELLTHAVSLGGVDSLLQIPAAGTHANVEEEFRPDDGIVRISVGLENVEDLIADLEQALAHVGA